MLLPLTQISNTVGQVMFPALSKIQEDPSHVKRIYLRTLSVITLITFPLMAGLVAVADHFVLTLYGEKWVGMVPLLQILGLVGMMQSAGSTIGWIYQSQGRTDWIFRWGLGAGALLISSIVLGIYIGSVEAVAICYGLMNLVLFFPSFYFPGKLIGLTTGEIANLIFHPFWMSVSMAGVVWRIGSLLPGDWSHGFRLLIQIGIGVGIYLLLVHFFRMKSYQDLKNLIIEQWKVKMSQGLIQ